MCAESRLAHVLDFGFHPSRCSRPATRLSLSGLRDMCLDGERESVWFVSGRTLQWRSFSVMSFSLNLRDWVPNLELVEGCSRDRS